MFGRGGGVVKIQNKKIGGVRGGGEGGVGLGGSGWM